MECDPCMLLGGYRVLDLTDEKGLFCAKILADLGADVIKIEKPGGDSARYYPPFCYDEPDPGKSLYWFAYNVNKRGITLDIESDRGGGIFKRLVSRSDILVESYPVGYMEQLGLSYAELEKVNPKVVMTSVTPFGQIGPYKGFKACDMTLQAMGGVMTISGPPDRPPVRVGVPIGYLLGSAYAAVGTLVALCHREITGEGQFVDVSILESLLPGTANALPFWYLNRVNIGRYGVFRPVGIDGSIIQRQIYPCKDGFISFGIYGGRVGAKSNKALVKLIESEAVVDEYVSSVNWEEYDMATTTAYEQSKMMECFGNFFLSHTKDELYAVALQKDISLLPVSSLEDLLRDPQLDARQFWVEASINDEIPIKYPQAFVKLSEGTVSLCRRAPLIGEHNEEIYISELGFSKEEFSRLKEKAII